MEENINVSEEMQEVAEPASDVVSEEMQEVAEPVKEDNSTEETKTKQDSAFAEQRRRIKEQEERIAELESQNQGYFDALSKFFEGDNSDDLLINANAYAEQRDPDEYRQEYERNAEFESLKKTNDALQTEIQNLKVEQLMREGLKEVQSIDPNIKSLDELGETFAKFIGAGLTTKEAYYATITRDAKEKVQAPDAIGKVSDTKVERDYYTSEELDNLSPEEMDKNWDKVMRSMNRL